MTTDPLNYDATELYRLWDTHGQLLYIGITTHVPSRMRQHRKDKPWWNQVANITSEQYATRKEAEQHEKHAIRHEHPKYNIVGQPTFTLPRKPSAIFKRAYIEQIRNTPAPRTRRQHQSWIAFLEWYENLTNDEYAFVTDCIDEYERRINDEYVEETLNTQQWLLARQLIASNRQNLLLARQLIADKRQQIAQATIHDN